MDVKPQIIIDSNIGVHNSKNWEVKVRENAYKDLSTVCVIPTRGKIASKIVQYWWALQPPMNQMFIRIFVQGMEVGAAYSQAVENILAHPQLSLWKYILFLEEDNAPPSDGLIKLYENMDRFDAIGGLYWTKGEAGKPMCYGNPNVFPVNFIPFLPPEETITECRGLGMGFTLIKMDVFKDTRLTRPFFVSGNGYTQDLKFFENIGKLGYKMACDTRVKVGHWDENNQIMW